MIQNKQNLFSIAFFVLGSVILTSADAAVVSRAGNRTSVASRMPTVTTRTKTLDTTATQTTVATETSDTETSDVIIEEASEEEIIIENKASQFDEILGNTTADSDSDDSALAAQIRAQRDAIDARDASNIVTAKTTISQISGKNTCDETLRACMQAKCGNDYSKCAGDTDTLWGDKMDSCRRDTTCTGHEYAIFTPEIKADRDMNARVAQYNAIVDCGNKYNSCIIEKCGTTFSQCLGKSAGDKAIQDCSKIAKECQERDSGLASRMMGAFGTLRQDAEKQVIRDEEKLYALRDEMANTCKRLGAMFDERTLDCVYTVNFYAGEDNTLYASKKLYAGSTFNCEPNWFGIDVTTFMENAFRLTREQTAASSAMLGAGLGIGVGAVTSGAIDRAVDRTKAEKELKKAKKENDEAQDDDDKSSTKEERQANREEKKAKRQAEKEKKAQDKENEKFFKDAEKETEQDLKNITKEYQQQQKAEKKANAQKEKAEKQEVAEREKFLKESEDWLKNNPNPLETLQSIQKQ
ncbi:MAG: hypothetical protein E7006_02420 [Alphaproteobacteria bacterium]|nr:hypothetical protein [Alphaproteobacteria bacterium]